MKTTLKIVVVLLFAMAVIHACTNENGVYVSTEMHTETGGKYFCTFETKEIYYEYMQERVRSAE